MTYDLFISSFHDLSIHHKLDVTGCATCTLRAQKTATSIFLICASANPSQSLDNGSVICYGEC